MRSSGASSEFGIERGTSKGASGFQSPRFLLTALTACAVLGLDAATPLGLAIWLLHVILIWLATFWANRAQLRAIAAICSLFTVLGFLWSQRSRIEYWIAITNTLMAIGAIWGIAQIAMRNLAAQEAREAADRELAKSREEVKILAGFLPICSSCKKIRNEAGAWEQMESYISQHSEAQFSHGFCQPCIARLYPELAEAPHDSGE